MRVAGLFIVVFCLFTAQSLALAQAPERFGLQEFLEAAGRSPVVAEADARVDFAAARQLLAQSFLLPSGKFDVVGGPSPSAEGDAVSGRTDYSRWGFASGFRVELIQPIYTFGAGSAGREASLAGTEVEKALAERARAALRMEIAELYFSFQLAFDLGELAAGAEKRLETALEQGVEMRRLQKKGAPTESDLDRLRVFLADLKVRGLEAEKARELVRSAMAWKLGVDVNSLPRWDRANLSLLEVDAGQFATERAQEIAEKSRPEYRALSNGVTAKRALVEVEESLLLPSIFAAGQLSYSLTGVRQDQASPFAYDPLNDFSGALYVGLRWNLGMFERRARLQMARAELIEAEAKARHLKNGLKVEVDRAVGNYTQAKAAIPLRDEAKRAARRVYMDQLAGFALGSVKAQALLEAIGAFALSEKAYLESIYAHNVSVFGMERALGHKLPQL